MEKSILKEIDQKANAVISRIHYNGEGLVSTDRIIQAVSEITDTDISFSYASFSELNVPNGNDVGAMMQVRKASNGRKQTANIILNSDKDLKFRRFSLIHELGHLINKNYTIEEDDEYTLSAHIQYNVTSFSENQCKQNPVIESEERANIFALKVLMPTEAFIDQVLNKNSFLAIADFFGVSEDAVRSRALLGA